MTLTLLLCPQLHTQLVVTKLRAVRDMLGEFWTHIAFFWLAKVGRNHFINTKFTKHIMEISDPSNHHASMPITKYVRVFEGFTLNI